MDDVIERFGLRAGLGGQFPAINVYDTGEDVLVAVEAPGKKKEDKTVEIREQVLTLSGSRPAAQPEGATLLRKECPHGEFMRAISLPAAVSGDGSEAKFKDGVLSVRLHKTEAAKPRAIAIQA